MTPKGTNHREGTGGHFLEMGVEPEEGVLVRKIPAEPRSSAGVALFPIEYSE